MFQLEIMCLISLENFYFTVVTLMCFVFLLSSKRYLNCPFSPGIEEHAGNGEIPSYEGSTVLFLLLCVA